MQDILIIFLVGSDATNLFVHQNFLGTSPCISLHRARQIVAIGDKASLAQPHARIALLAYSFAEKQADPFVASTLRAIERRPTSASIPSSDLRPKMLRLRVINAPLLMSLDAADSIHSRTRRQRPLPELYRPGTTGIRDGIDAGVARFEGERDEFVLSWSLAEAMACRAWP